VLQVDDALSLLLLATSLAAFDELWRKMACDAGGRAFESRRSRSAFE
jgi:hypothetical protein